MEPTEEEEGQSDRRQCQLCPSNFKCTKSLVRHYESRHNLGKHEDMVRSIPRSPKKECGRCGKAVSNPWAHKHTCKAAKMAGDGTTSGESAEPSPEKKASLSGGASQLSPSSESAVLTPTGTMKPQRTKLSNEDFIRMYQKWLSSASGNFAQSKTIYEYVRHLKGFVAKQSAQREGFQARHWITFNSGNFTPLASIVEWIPPATGSATANHMICAYKHLLGLIRSNLLLRGEEIKNFNHKTLHLDRRNIEAATLARKFKAGRFAGSTGPTPRREHTQSIDTDGFKALIKAYLRDHRKEAAFNSFAGKQPYFLFDVLQLLLPLIKLFHLQAEAGSASH